MSRTAGKSIKSAAQLSGGKGDGAKTARGTSPNVSGLGTGISFGGVIADDGSLEDQQSLAGAVAELEQSLTAKQEEFVKKERAFKLRIEELENEIQNQRKEKTGWMKSNEKMSKLKEMQSDILYRVELVQDRTSKILQEQERDLLRAFRARLFDVQTELEKEKSKKDDGAVAWIERSRRLEAEVEWTKEVADKLEGVNQALLQENSRLQSQFQYSKQEHGFMLEKLASMTSENEMLRKRYKDKDAENDKLRSENAKILAEIQSLGPGAATGKTGHKHAPHETEEKYKDNNIKLKKQLEEERKSHKAVTENLAFEISNQTELEKILRHCVDDVRHEIARRNLELSNYSNTGADLARLYNSKPALVPIEDFKQSDRERVLEILLAQERVVNILYGNRAFGAASSRSKFGGGLGLLNIGDFGSGGSTGGPASAGAAMSPLSITSTPGPSGLYTSRQQSGLLDVGASSAIPGLSVKQLSERPSTTGGSVAGSTAGASHGDNGATSSSNGNLVLPQLTARPGTSGR